MIYFNELKSISRGLFDIYKKVMDYERALDAAIKASVERFTIDQILSPGRKLESLEAVTSQIKVELEKEINLFVDDGSHYSLSDSEGHLDWYRAKKAGEHINFRFWGRYKNYLKNEKGWATSSVDNLDTITDEVLEKLEDPTVKNREFDRRALIVGYVQSGKTANFMGVINKAIDTGYRVIIVLAGIHENLRQQTQERIDQEIMGRDTSKGAVIKRIGVAAMPGEVYMPIDNLTESNFKPNGNGDFNIKKSHGVPPTSERAILFVVKKNKSILNNLIKYFEDWIETFDESLTYKRNGIKQLNNLPLLLIDDEADQASINTKPLESKDGDESDPTAINACIRKLLMLFRQKVYLAYTATPFANIFIHHDKPHTTLGLDLFPFSFIISLDAPSNYLGPRRVFGLNNSLEDGLPIYRAIRDAGSKNSTFMPLKHKSDYVPSEISASLKTALNAFVLASAIRWFRGQEREHNTMLIHCTRFNIVQIAIGQLVNEYFQVLRGRVLGNDHELFENLKKLYESDFLFTSRQMEASLPTWQELSPFLRKSIKKIENYPLIINGSVGDLLDYSEKKDTGLSVIIVGGDKLSRGLTLDGLTISYFTRSTSMYDTLMQMGRWFGYRPGFEDLCRIYTTPELYSWYRHISTAFETLRSEFIEMSRLKLTPRAFGLRVLSHPDMMITNVMKMRQAEPLMLDYQGTLTETTTLPSSTTTNSSNYFAAEKFIRKLGPPSVNTLNKIVWLDCEVDDVQSFLKEYHTYKGLPAANSNRINEYITLQLSKEIPEFQLWNVGLVTLNKKDTAETVEFAGHKIVLPRRTITARRSDSFFIKRMHDPGFELLDFSEAENEVVRKRKLTRLQSRSVLPRKNKPLLLIYVLNVEEIDLQSVGFAIAWPASSTTISLNYYINTVYQELEMTKYD